MFKYILPLSLLASLTLAGPVPQSPNEIRPLLVGAGIPKVELKNPAGEPVELSSLVSEKPTLLIFYRGGWCPYCMRHLAALQTIEHELLAQGMQIVAVSADRPEKLKAVQTENKLNYLLLSDNDMNAARAFGIAFQVPEETVRKYREEYKIDLEADSGRTHHQLPVPAVFLIGSDGRIAFVHVNPDYRSRLDPQLILAAARTLAE